MKTKNIKQYRRNYYIENRDYLIDYQKWYYNHQAKDINIEKPIRSNRKYITKNDPDYTEKKVNKYLEIKNISTVIHFD